MRNFPEVVTQEFVLLGPSTPTLRCVAEPPPVRFATELAGHLHDRWADDPAVTDSFGGRDTFTRSLEQVDVLDEVFRRAGADYFQLGGTPAEASQNFAATQLKYRRIGVRPSLPGQVAHHLDQIALPRGDPHYRAALLVAARAELEHPSRPEYHNAYHFSDVIAATIEFLKKNNTLAVESAHGAIKLSRQELAIGIIAAAGHDAGHPGGKNALPGESSAPDPFRLERRSASIVAPLLRAAQLPFASAARITAAILATSPDCNGPARLLKEIDRLHDAGELIEWSKLPLHEEFPELRLVAEDPVTRVIAQNLRCADLAQSCLFGTESNQIATHALQNEWSGRGYSDMLLGDTVAGDGKVIPGGKTVRARMGFLDFGAFGESGPTAAGARAAVGQNYADLYADSKVRLDSVLAQEKLHAVVPIGFDPVA